MQRIQNLDHDLRQNIGGDGYFPHFIRHNGKHFLYTYGAQYLADKYNCYWLLDVLFSHAMEIYANPAIPASPRVAST